MSMILPKGSIMVWTRGSVTDGVPRDYLTNAIDTWDKFLPANLAGEGGFEQRDDETIDILIPSEHNRAAVSIDVERIKTSNRMANGRLREYIVGDKRTWSTSWELLPAPSDATVDGRAGATDIERFYNTINGSFILSIVSGPAGAAKDITLVKHYEVVFSDFSSTLDKRGKYDMCGVSVTMEQV